MSTAPMSAKTQPVTHLTYVNGSILDADGQPCTVLNQKGEAIKLSAVSLGLSDLDPKPLALWRHFTDLAHALPEPFKLAAWFAQRFFTGVIITAGILSSMWVGMLGVGLIPVVGPAAVVASWLFVASDIVISVEIAALLFVRSFKELWDRILPMSWKRAPDKALPQAPTAPSPASRPEEEPTAGLFDRVAVAILVGGVSLSFLLIAGVLLPYAATIGPAAGYAPFVWVTAEVLVFITVTYPVLLLTPVGQWLRQVISGAIKVT